MLEEKTNLSSQKELDNNYEETKELKQEKSSKKKLIIILVVILVVAISAIAFNIGMFKPKYTMSVLLQNEYEDIKLLTDGVYVAMLNNKSDFKLVFDSGETIKIPNKYEFDGIEEEPEGFFSKNTRVLIATKADKKAIIDENGNMFGGKMFDKVVYINDNLFAGWDKKGEEKRLSPTGTEEKDSYGIAKLMKKDGSIIQTSKKAYNPCTVISINVDEEYSSKLSNFTGIQFKNTIMDSKGETIFDDTKINVGMPYSTGFSFTKNDMHGFMDYKGNIIVPAKFDNVFQINPIGEDMSLFQNIYKYIFAERFDMKNKEFYYTIYDLKGNVLIEEFKGYISPSGTNLDEFGILAYDGNNFNDFRFINLVDKTITPIPVDMSKDFRNKHDITLPIWYKGGIIDVQSEISDNPDKIHHKFYDTSMNLLYETDDFYKTFGFDNGTFRATLEKDGGSFLIETKSFKRIENVVDINVDGKIKRIYEVENNGEKQWVDEDNNVVISADMYDSINFSENKVDSIGIQKSNDDIFIYHKENIGYGVLDSNFKKLCTIPDVTELIPVGIHTLKGKLNNKYIFYDSYGNKLSTKDNEFFEYDEIVNINKNDSSLTIITKNNGKFGLAHISK